MFVKNMVYRLKPWTGAKWSKEASEANIAPGTISIVHDNIKFLSRVGFRAFKAVEVTHHGDLVAIQFLNGEGLTAADVFERIEANIMMLSREVDDFYLLSFNVSPEKSPVGMKVEQIVNITEPVTADNYRDVIAQLQSVFEGHNAAV